MTTAEALTLRDKALRCLHEAMVDLRVSLAARRFAKLAIRRLCKHDFYMFAVEVECHMRPGLNFFS